MSGTIWSEDFWLPKNTSWNEFHLLEQHGTILPRANDLLYVFPLAILLYLTRITFEYFIAQPVGRWFAIRDCQVNLSKRNVGTSPLAKFSESTWRFTFYLFVFIYGTFVLRNKIWFEDTRHCWLNHPNHPLSADVFWYYMIELAFYWSLIFSQFIDVKRKDFWQMFLHHIATIALLSFSYVVNFVRIGTLVLIIHDAGDYWLECAKMAKYARAQRLCDIMFIVFAIVWFLTRLCYYPYKVLYTTTFEEWSILGLYPAYYVFNSLLFLLQILHYFWFYLICQVAISACKAGKVTKDERSDSDDDEQTSTTGEQEKDK